MIFVFIAFLKAIVRFQEHFKCKVILYVLQNNYSFLRKLAFFPSNTYSHKYVLFIQTYVFLPFFSLCFTVHCYPQTTPAQTNMFPSRL